LVWQLACHKTGGANLPGVPDKEGRNVQFPINDRSSQDDPRRIHAKGKLKHVLPEHRAIIFRPYSRP
jgi:hypothetical protein